MTMKPSADPDCVLALDFAEAGGNIAYDLSGKNINGTIMGAVRTNAPVGKALKFDGVDDGVDLGIPDELQLRKGIITVEMLLKYTEWNSDTHQELFFGGATGGLTGYGIMLYRYRENSIYYEVMGETNERYRNTVNNCLEQNVWNYIVAIFNNVEHYMSLYVNAEQKDLYTFPDPGEVVNTKKFTIGYYYTEIYHLKGELAFIRVYKRLLSEREIREHYHYLTQKLRE